MSIAFRVPCCTRLLEWFDTSDRNVQKQNRSWSSCLAMIIAEHSAESLTPFDSGVRFANGAERPQQAVF